MRDASGGLVIEWEDGWASLMIAPVCGFKTE